MGTLTHFQKDDWSFANNLIHHKSAYYDEIDGAESKWEVEFASENIIVCMFNEEIRNSPNALTICV